MRSNKLIPKKVDSAVNDIDEQDFKNEEDLGQESFNYMMVDTFKKEIERKSMQNQRSA